LPWRLHRSNRNVWSGFRPDMSVCAWRRSWWVRPFNRHCQNSSSANLATRRGHYAAAVTLPQCIFLSVRLQFSALALRPIPRPHNPDTWPGPWYVCSHHPAARGASSNKEAGKMGFVSHFVLPLRTFSRVVMAMMVRFSFRAIEAVSIFEFSSAKSCASCSGVHGRPLGRGPSFISALNPPTPWQHTALSERLGPKRPILTPKRKLRFCIF
jgi:hypothetical protein